ncbi:MAG: hypothetical protein F6J89_29090 [Symploca sp. SIO1C4]|uniref:Uncharacterized protein n=1 Tax=Symploca sp. SIO1C4 TaxID=2607765 RepID=A0A6B3NMW1_9CYAN|nr:hypothetical protein [Symploca sp. SIO1C4]NET09419.1 hypothetical protein [Symploca sp. SIO2B6]
MAQFSVNISEQEFELLNLLSERTGRSNSSLAGEWIRQGLSQEVEKQMKIEQFKQMLNTQEQQVSSKSRNKKH